MKKLIVRWIATHWAQKAGSVKNPYFGKSMLNRGNQVKN